jgi:hypothetical protein
MKRLVAIILAVVLTGLAACSSGGSRTENKIEDISFGISFNYDEGWTRENAESGIALKSSPDTSGVSHARITITAIQTGLTNVGEYWDAYQSSLKAAFTDYTLKKEFTGDEAVKLDGKDAVRIEYTASVGGEKYRFGIVLCIRDGYVYNILLTAKDGVFDTHSPCLDTITGSFKWIGNYTGDESSETSTGGKVESPNEDYYFELSAGWQVIRNDGMTAVKPVDGNASVSVTAFSLDEDKQNYGAYNYWKEYEVELKKTYPTYVLTKEYTDNEPKLDGVAATRKEYDITIDGVKYRYIQVICILNGYVYSVMFTSNEAEFDKYYEAFDKIIDSFNFI